jgi:hypothetical protein
VIDLITTIIINLAHVLKLSRPQSRVRFDKSTERSRLRSRPNSRSEDHLKSYSAAEEETDNSWPEDSDDSIEEFAGISCQQRSEIPPSDWISDTGCTSPTTDKPELFSSPLIPCRRGIKVGGGSLYLVSRGTAQCKLKDGTSVCLPDSLLVPGLGCNLMSARKICSREIIGQFDDKRMIFSKRDDGTPLIEASLRHG